MPYVEFEDKNVDKAVAKACEELRIARDNLKYDVISYGSTGIFGLVGSKKAKIRVLLSEGSEKDRKRRAGTGLDRDTATQVKNLIDEAFQDFTPKKKESKNKPKPQRASESENVAAEPAEAPEVTASAPLEPAPEINHEEEDKQEPFDMAPLASKGEAILQKMVEAISTEEAQITAEHSQNRIVYQISQGNAAMLIGKKGQTLEAMQYLLDKIVNQEINQRIKVLVDVDGYLAKRESSLRKLSGKLANRVKRTGKPITMSLMNAHERRVVHLCLKDDKNVRTQSMGEGYYRKLIIFPKKGAPRRKKGAEKGNEN